ncbi:hypothetical protein SAMN05443572_108118 [Myxococcus fulvus]|nr:hypothetical protein [Myxococcus fulvus]SEU29028.1 hypothetical protein SAMN05443572_108118 [Myxococcus fulvus]
MNLWIALAAGLSVAQGQSETRYPSPMDPNVRDPAAEALRDANEQAAEEADGAWIPPNYVIQQPTTDGTTPYGGYVVTPALPDGRAPATPSEVAVDETYQSYVPIPAQVQEGTGGSGTEENVGPTVSDTDLGVSGSGAVGDEGGDARVNQPGGSNTSALPQPAPAPLGGQDSTGGSGDYGTVAPQGSESSGQVDGTGGSGTTPQTSVPNDQGGIGGSGITPQTSVPNDPSGIGGSGTTPQTSIPNDQSGIGGSGTTPQTSVPNDPSGIGGSGTTPQTSVPNDQSGVGTSTTPQTSVPNDSSGVGTGTTTQPSTQTGTGGSGAQPETQDSLGGFGPTEAEQGGGQNTPNTAPVSPNGTGGSGSNTVPQSTDTQGTSVPQNNTTQSTTSGQQQTSATSNPPAANDTEVAQRRARLDELEEELRARDAEIEQNAVATQQQVDTFGERAVETEQSRQQRLSALQSAGEWMMAADAAIQQGEDDVDDALDIADSAFAEIRESAASFGQGNVIVHADRARALLNLARDAAGRSDGYAARLALQEAGVELNLARGASLGRSGTGNSLLTP